VSIQQDGSPAAEPARQPSRGSRRRKQALVAVVGLAALLGGGAFFVTEARMATETILPDAAHAPPAPAPAVVPAPAASATPATPAISVRSSALSAARVSRTASPQPETMAERIAEMQASALSATEPPLGRGEVPDSALTVSRSGSARTGTLKVVSARADLSGQQELAWLAGPGDKVGDAECSQRIRLSADVPVMVHPTLLLCWKTSAAKSVYTLAVNPKGKPSAKVSVAALDRRWATLG
jgi:hypothetical protein